MKIRHFLLILPSLFLFQSCRDNNSNRAAQEETKNRLDSLYEHHQYFLLRDSFESSSELLEEKDRLLLQAKIHSVFNEREASNDLIAQLLSEFGEELTENERIELLQTRISNSVFLFDYEEALKSTEELLASDSISDEQKEEHQNTRLIYRTLKGIPEQAVFLQRSELPITKDIAGLSRIPVDLNALEQKVVFDTGANFSVITDSLAHRARVEVVGESFKVKAITGGKVDSRLGIMDSLTIGNSVLRNVVFLVFPEASLSFPEANYTIDAILGFPIINALGEIMMINGERFLITAETSASGPENLALDFLTPIVEVFQDSTSLPFTFDTGASSTALYQDYFSLRREEIMKKGHRDTLRFGGAGGVIRTPVYYSTFSGRIGESSFSLDSAAVHIEKIQDNPGIYGNLGQDVLSQFDTLVIDFENMSFLLK